MSGVPGKGRGRGSGDKDDEKRKAEEQHKRKIATNRAYTAQKKEETLEKKAKEKQEREAIHGPDPTMAELVDTARNIKNENERKKRAAKSSRSVAEEMSLEDAFHDAGRYAARLQHAPAAPHQARQPNPPIQDPFQNLDPRAIQAGAPLKRRRRRRGPDGWFEDEDPEPAPIAQPRVQAWEPPHIQAGNFQQVPEQQPAPMLSVPSASRAPAQAQRWETPSTQTSSSRPPSVPLSAMPQTFNPTTTPARSLTRDTAYTQASSFQQPPRQQPPTFVSHYPLAGPDTQQTQPPRAFQQPPRQQPPTFVSHYPQAGQDTHQTQPPRAFQQPPPRLELGYAAEYAPHHPQGYTPHQSSAYGSQQGSNPYDASRDGYDARRAFPETPRPQRTASDSDPSAAVTQPLESLYITPRPIRQPTYQAPPMGATTANPSGRPRHSPPSEDDDARPARRRNTGDTEGKQPPRKSNMRSLLHHTPSPPSQN